LASLRRGWFVEFERLFLQEFAATFCGAEARQWAPAVSESEWTVSATDAAAGVTVTLNLPYNYLLFRPESVARNVVTRLHEQAATPSRLPRNR
jgi:hypothetical protein